MRELGLGMSGTDVRRWERFLIRARMLGGPPAGFFGPDLATATSSYQRASGLDPTGRADAATLAHALAQGLLDRELEEPPGSAEPAPAAPKTSRWTVMGPVMVAAAAAVGTFITSVGVEFVKYQSGLEAERARLQSLLIQQALRVDTPAGAAAWRNNEAQLEVVSRLRGYVRLGLIQMEPATLEAFLSDLGSVPVTRTTIAAVQVPTEGLAPPTTVSPVPHGPRVDGAGTPSPAQHYTQRVFIQFAGSIARDQVIRMARDLSAQWRVEGADRGGERIGTAVGLREVRWGHPDDEAAAVALADAVERTGVIQGEVTAKRVPAVGRNTLEVWISP